jgi:hypothetical protein
MSATGPQSFQQRAITVTFTLGTGTFGATGANTAKLSGLRVTTTIRKGGAPSFDSAELDIFGVTPDVMNAVTTLGAQPIMVRKNMVLIEAGDPVKGMTQVYFGFIQSAFQDFNGQPQTSLHVNSYSEGAYQSLIPTTPTSFPASADVATIMSGFAERMGLAFENNGVQVQLSSPYFAGNLTQQVLKCAEAAGIVAYIDTSSTPNTLAIWPRWGTRGGVVPLISSASGMIGYPRFYDQGIQFETVFNPNIKVGGVIQMQSSIGTAVTYLHPEAPKPEDVVAGGPNGLYYVNGPLIHNLSAQVPGGPWVSQASCARLPGAPAKS